MGCNEVSAQELPKVRVRRDLADSNTIRPQRILREYDFSVPSADGAGGEIG